MLFAEWLNILLLKLSTTQEIGLRKSAIPALKLETMSTMR